MESPGNLIQFVGRLHVVLLHLPIGFLILLGALELISTLPKYRHAALANRFVLWLVVPVAILTATCGWLLAESGGYDARLLFLHRWTGVGVALAACLLLGLHLRGWVSVYRVLLGATVLLTIVAGHYGGALTHGSDYLTRYLPGKSDPTSAFTSEGTIKNDPSDFVAVEQVFGQFCVSCHGPEKSKGGLRLDSPEHVLAGGDSGPVIIPGDAHASLLIKRVMLPVDDDDHMPPEGKPQPTAEALEIIHDWIDSAPSE